MEVNQAHHRTSRRAALGLLAGVLAARAAQANRPIRALLVTGGHPHDLSFYRVFDGIANLEVNVDPHPHAYQGDLRRAADLIIQFDMHDLEEPRKRANLQAYVEAGKGLLILHHALVNNPTWDWWSQQVSGVKYLQKATAELPASTYRHDTTIAIRPVRKHPITAGVGPFSVYDETYKGMWFAPGIVPLLATDHPDGDPHIAWLGPNPNYRVACLQPGHGPQIYADRNYRRLLANMVQWATASENVR